jgi:hypothetical protein
MVDSFKIFFERERFKRDFKPFPFSRFFPLSQFNTFFKNQHPSMSSQCFFAA